MRKFDKQDWAGFHDTIYDATDVSYNQESLEKMFDVLPNGIKMTAYEWGMSDTVFGDNVYKHFKPKEVKKEEPVDKKPNHREPIIMVIAGIKGYGRKSVICPSCGSTNLTQIADHSSHGYNGYICNDCKCNFGN